MIYLFTDVCSGVIGRNIVDAAGLLVVWNDHGCFGIWGAFWFILRVAPAVNDEKFVVMVCFSW